MAPSAARSKLRASAPAIRSSTRAPASDLLCRRSRRLRRGCRVKDPRLLARALLVPGSKIRDADWCPQASRKLAADGAGRQKGKGGDELAAPRVALARRLAAALWYLRPSEVSGARSNAVVGFPKPGRISNDSIYSTIGLHVSTENVLASPILAHHLKNGILQKFEASSSLPFYATEKATKWDPGCSNVLEDVCQFYGHLKLLEDQQVNTVSVMSALQLELEQARKYINELESERQSAKKRLDHFLKRLAEEKASWRSREHEKVCNVVEHIKDDLRKERKNRKWLEVVNAKLVSELAEAKLSAKKCLQSYEKERKARQLMEEVCDDLAKEIGEDKAEVEALKRESMRMRDEVDEERRMLQMAEVWREERVQMKLVDAKLMLEEKYVQLCNLKKDIEAFLRVQSGAGLNLAAVKEAEMLNGAASSVKVQDIELSYQPPASEDIFSIFEELQPREDTHEREIEQCYGYSPDHISKMHTVSPETDIFLQNSAGCANRRVNIDGDAEDDSGWETISQVEEQASCNSPEVCAPSVSGIYQESCVSVGGAYLDGQIDDGKLNGEISEVCSTATRQSRKKVSSIGRFWRTSRPSNGHKKNSSAELSNGRLSSCRRSNVTQNSDAKNGEVVLSSPSVGQHSPDSLNPHITRGMKGCVEWPRGVHKHSLKAKLLEARMESRKIQLLQSTKQKELT
ncbi:hypothetical protein Cni_G26898 [Canna indica]|uniref:Uncharacterized protein n=1 Tax=Canna indica TaxID=4628 RepID=A0AAQ3QRP6_9LILI|nr:hypothetical protein Cni_G26898 [Canna indica]